MKLGFLRRLCAAGAVSALALGGAATVQSPAEAAPIQVVSVTLSGAYNYSNQGQPTAGNVAVGYGSFGALSINGAVQVPGKKGGAANLNFAVNPLLGLPIYLGSVDISDPNAGINVSTPIFFGAVNPTSTGVGGGGTWFKINSLDILGSLTGGSAPLLETWTLNYSIQNLSGNPGNVAPKAAFTTTAQSGYAPLSVGFDGTGSYDPDGTISKYEWNFGDGGIDTTTGKVVSHTYVAPGVYTARLTVTDNGGGTDTTTQLISVQAVPPPADPLNVRVTSAYTSNIYVAWDAAGPADSYQVKVKSTFGCIFYEKVYDAAAVAGTAQSYHVTWSAGHDICNGSHYNVAVRAVRAGQYSNWVAIDYNIPLIP